jgi:hypothetical protein
MQESTLLREGILANHSARLESEKVQMTHATSGLKCSELLSRQDPLGCCVRMLLDTLPVDSMRCGMIWREKVTPANQLLYQLVPLTPRTFAVEFGLWRTCTAGDGTHNHKATSPSQLTKKTTLMLTVQAQVSEGKGRGHLNPEWVEWLMGFPEGWTNLD